MNIITFFIKTFQSPFLIGFTIIGYVAFLIFIFVSFTSPYYLPLVSLLSAGWILLFTLGIFSYLASQCTSKWGYSAIGVAEEAHDDSKVVDTKNKRSLCHMFCFVYLFIYVAIFTAYRTNLKGKLVYFRLSIVSQLVLNLNTQPSRRFPHSTIRLITDWYFTKI
jgi:hypothetical protein